jgi:CheY-like chemotaxis protein
MSGKKLLVADDSLTIQKVIRLALSHEGYEIQTVSEGNEAIEQILLFRPRIVLIDVSLPGKTAIEVKAAIDTKPELSGTQFVLMSSAFETVDEGAIEKAGFMARLTKPFDPAHLRKLVSEAFDGEEQSAAPAPNALPSLDLPPLKIPSAAAAAASGAPPPPPFQLNIPTPPPAAAAPQDDSDIRALTQSTLQMAGLDDLDWRVSEPPRKEMPAFDLPPLPAMAESLAPPSLTPPSKVVSNVMGSDAGSAYFSPHLDDDLPPPVPAQPIEAAQQHEAYAVPTDELEALVRQQVEAALLKVSKEMLPQLAEKILKQEINRLLNEVP